MQSIHNAVFQKISIVENELKSNINFKVIFNIEYQTVESMQCFSLNNSLDLHWLFICLLCILIQCVVTCKRGILKVYLDKQVLPCFFSEVYTK